MAHHEGLRRPEAGCEQHQQHAGPVDGQHLEAVEADDEADAAERGGEDQAGVVELDDDPEHAEREHQGDDVRVDERVEDALPEAHLHLGHLGARGVEHEPARHGLHAVDLVEQRGRVGAMTSMTSIRERLTRAEVRADADGGVRPLRVAPVLLRERAQLCRRVVDHLAPQVFLDVLASDRDRRRGAEVRLRRHGEDVGRLADPDTGRGSPGAVGRDVDDDRDVRRELLLHDVAHRLGEAAGRVEHDDDGVVAALVRTVDLILDVRRRHGIDVVVEVDGEHLRCGRHCRLREDESGEQRQRGEKSPQNGRHHGAPQPTIAGASGFKANEERAETFD